MFDSFLEVKHSIFIKLYQGIASFILCSGLNLVTAYDQAEKARLDRIARDEYLLDQGWKEGRKAGLDEGRKEGHRDIALTLLGMNMPIDEIVAITGLTQSEILELRKS